MPDQQLRRLAAAARRLRDAPALEQLGAAVLDGVAELLPGHGAVLAVLGDGGDYELALYRDVELAAAHALLAAPATARALAADRPVLLPASVLAPGAEAARQPAPLAVALSAAGRRAGVLVLVPMRDGATRPDAGEPDPETPELLALLALQTGLALDAFLARRAETAGRAYLDGVVGAVPVPLLLVAADGTLAALNALGAELFGLSPDFDRGRPVKGRLRAPELEALCLPGPEGELDVRVGSGAARRELHARVVRVAGGGDAKVAVFQDDTAAREMERLKADFVAVVGHELRTPLTVIKGYVHALARRGEAMEPAARARMLAEMQGQAGRLERLLEDLLLLSGLKAEGAIELERADENLVALADGVLDRFRAEHPGRAFELRAPRASVVAHVDRARLEQVLRHLVDNAVKFSSPDDAVSVTIRETAEQLELEVVDHGEGVFSGHLPRLFDRFQQLDGSATRGQGGAGVGLHVAKVLVEAHKGTIAARSALGKGSTFTVTLPRGLVSSGTGARGVAQARPLPPSGAA
jgi:two-component system phosphate regulon sensor histidine kinase PhoR